MKAAMAEVLEAHQASVKQTKARLQRPTAAVSCLGQFDAAIRNHRDCVSEAAIAALPEDPTDEGDDTPDRNLMEEELDHGRQQPAHCDALAGNDNAEIEIQADRG